MHRGSIISLAFKMFKSLPILRSFFAADLAKIPLESVDFELRSHYAIRAPPGLLFEHMFFAGTYVLLNRI